MTTTQLTTLFDRIGGEAAIKAAARGLVARIVADPELAPYFAGVDPEPHVEMLAKFVSSATGGPARYAGRNMHAAHAHLGITHEHFNRVARHLADELAALGVDEHTAGDLVAVVATLAPQIVSD
jgi:hemoglobin